MDLELSEEQRMLEDLVTKFVTDELMPLENTVLAREARGEGSDSPKKNSSRSTLAARNLGFGVDARVHGRGRSRFR